MPNADTAPDYAALIRYLVEPLLDEPDTLKVSCEFSLGQQRALVRVAFNETEQGRVLGRGGRNIEAMRTVLTAAAQGVGQTARLEVFDLRRSERRTEGSEEHRSGSGDRRRSNNRARPSKPPAPRKR